MIKKIRNFFGSIKDGIENLIIWFPVIWKDRDWDQFYLYIILRKKLINMEKYQRKYGISTVSEKTADEIKVCVNLLNRLINDDYMETVFRKHDEKWGEINIEFEPYTDNLSKALMTRENVLTEKNKEDEVKEFKRLCKHEDMLRKQDVEYLFHLMNRHIQGWWD